MNHLKRIPLFHILCALTALGVGLAACAPATGNPIDTATALAKPTEVAATVATETLEPATATATKIATATEAFAPIEISTNPDKPTAITLEDVTSGRLAASERKLLQPFPTEAFMTGWTPMTEGDFISLNIDTSASLGRYKEDPNTRPEKIVSFSSLALKMDNGKTQNLTVIGIQVLNTDGTSAILHFACKSVNFQRTLEKLKSTSAAGFEINSSFPIESGEYFSTYLLSIQPDIPRLAGQLQNTGVIPKELEQFILVLTRRSRW